MNRVVERCVAIMRPQVMGQKKLVNQVGVYGCGCGCCCGHRSCGFGDGDMGGVEDAALSPNCRPCLPLPLPVCLPWSVVVVASIAGDSISGRSTRHAAAATAAAATAATAAVVAVTICQMALDRRQKKLKKIYVTGDATRLQQVTSCPLPCLRCGGPPVCLSVS